MSRVGAGSKNECDHGCRGWSSRHRGDDGVKHPEDEASGARGQLGPADAVVKVLGVEFKGDAEKARYATLVHWAYGSG